MLEAGLLEAGVQCMMMTSEADKRQIRLPTGNHTKA